MAITILSQQQLPVASEDDVFSVRARARELAEQLGFDPFATAAIVTATSELTRNAWRHAQRGTASICVLDNDGRVGLRVEVVDDGPGIVDVARALAGGNSTVRSLGLGLAGSKRLADEFAIESI